ncbi:phytase [Donghicola mangrovi]|uniref:Phytase n=1 Tax=Donghicola mangrovi TaxID=2729614 RepID=A0A850QGW3_9RHOB|nr:phytase [Donghicola mangrovi]NVO25299.1 phytase [Donghicola mangrovi]
MKSNALLLLAALLPAPLAAEVPQIMVQARAESAPIDGDADDPAIWVNPSDPMKSLVLGTDKTKGLYVFDLAGQQVDFLPDGKLNNVDIRPFRLMGEDVWLASAAERGAEKLVFWIIRADGSITHASPFAFDGVPADMADGVENIYGSALMRDPETGRVSALVNYKSGHVIQWDVTEQNGELALTYLRTLQVPSQPEGMVSDDRTGLIYVGEEDAAIWQFPAWPEGGDTGKTIANVPSDCFPRDDIEGLSIYDGAEGHYLVASSQGIHRAAIFDLSDAQTPCVGLVGVEAGEIDGVTETDGLDVTAAPLGPNYPAGMLVMMDDQNEMFTTGFKYMSFADVLAGLK